MIKMVFRKGDVHSAVIKELYEYELHEQYLRQVFVALSGIFPLYTLGTPPPPPPQNLTKLFILVFICQPFGRVLIL